MMQRIAALRSLALPLRRASSASVAGATRSKTTTGHYALLAIPVVTFGLGTWQVFRKQRKEDLITLMEGKLKQAAMPLGSG